MNESYRSVAYGLMMSTNTAVFHPPGQIARSNPLLGSVDVAHVEVVVTSGALLVVQKVHRHGLHLADFATITGVCGGGGRRG